MHHDNGARAAVPWVFARRERFCPTQALAAAKLRLRRRGLIAAIARGRAKYGTERCRVGLRESQRSPDMNSLPYKKGRAPPGTVPGPARETRARGLRQAC